MSETFRAFLIGILILAAALIPPLINTRISPSTQIEWSAEALMQEART